jgi:hypothetical protein
MNRKDLFACPFYFDKIEIDTDKVKSAVKETQVLGAMSLDEDIINTNFKFLFDPIDKIVCKVMLELGFKQYNIFTSWMTQTAIGYRHGLDHQHCNSFLSGILYLTDKASPILFRHPLPWRWSSGLDDKNDGMLKSNQLVMSPKKGDIVLFPSFVQHMIMPHKDPLVRYSIAFNVHPTGQYGARDSTINVSILKNL